MAMNISTLFSCCAENEYVARLANCEILTIEYSNDAQSIKADIKCDTYIDWETIHNAELVIKEAYTLNKFRLVPKFSPEDFTAQRAKELIPEIKREVPTVNGSLEGSEWTFVEPETLNISLALNCIELLGCFDFSKRFADLILSRFDKQVSIKVSYDDSLSDKVSVPKSRNDGVYKDSAAKKVFSDDLSKIGDMPVSKAPKQKAEQPDGLPEAVRATEILYGKSQRFPIIRMSELSVEYSKITVWGKVFDYKYRETKMGDKYFISFCMSDYSSSCSVKLFISKKEKALLDCIKDGVYLIVQGIYDHDQYDHEYTIKARYICLAEYAERKDNSEEKRIELHMHTNMSRMDAVAAVGDIVARAAKWGHKAIAITDHGVAQAFPGAMDKKEELAKKGVDIKILYGTEAYFVNDMVDIVYGETTEKFDGNFIVFDLETTGLEPESQRITEIGAVKIHGGEIVDRYSSFVNPKIPIPEIVIEKTGITNAMVKDAPDEEAAVPDFLEFCGKDTLLIAHNAAFDTGFLNAACQRLGIEFENPYLDTLALSRQLYPDIKSHKLENLVKQLGLPDYEAHRAFEDAEALTGVLLVMLKELGEKYGISELGKINTSLVAKDSKQLPRYHMIILAKNQVGLKNLYKLISYAHTKHFYRSPRTLKSELKELREGLIIGSACEAGELYKAILRGARWNELITIASFYDYLEIQPLSNNDFLIKNGTVPDEKSLIAHNKTICKLAKTLGKPVVATCDAHYIDPQDDIYRRILLNAESFDDANREQKLYFRTTEEMLEEFSYLGEKGAREVVIKNPAIIADMVEDIRPIPKGTYPPSIPGSDDDLRNITHGRAKELYGDPLPDYVRERLDKELNSIIKNGYSIMYIIAQRLVADSVAHGYQVGSRGSVGSSFVATMAGISEVNPLAPHYVCPSCRNSEFIFDGCVGSGFDLPAKRCPVCGTEYNRDGHDIPFETFLGFNGEKQPDIDLNFSNEYQSNSHKYTEELFGSDNVFKAGTIGTVADKTAYRYVMKYAEQYGYSYSNAEISRLTLGCIGVKSTTGQHPGGMVVVPGDHEVYDFCPIQHPANKTDSGIFTTHFDFHAIHDTILKLDELGHVCPTILKYLEDFTGIKVQDIPMSDPKVMSLFTSTDALGIEPEDIGSKTGTFSLPELGTAFVRQMLIDTRPETFADLLQVSGLSHGTGVYLGNAQDLIKSGRLTISQVIGTRDNIMLYLINKGMDKSEAFKITEIVRKGKAKKLLTDELVADMKAHDVPDWYIDSCFKIQYMFPKAHAAAYMIAALRMGWYKIYKPVEYYAAYFTSRYDNFDYNAAVGGISEARRLLKEIESKGKDASQTEEGASTLIQIQIECLARGINFLNADIYKSDAKMFLPENGALRIPFVALKGVGEGAARSLCAAAKEGAFISKSEVAQRSGVSRAVIETLSNAGALNELPDTSQLSLFSMFGDSSVADVEEDVISDD